MSEEKHQWAKGDCVRYIGPHIDSWDGRVGRVVNIPAVGDNPVLFVRMKGPIEMGRRELSCTADKFQLIGWEEYMAGQGLEGTTSKHADLLNTLDKMQGSMAYAARRDALRQAEALIVAQEQEIDRLQKIAAAAPDLLQACQTMLEAYRLIPIPECNDENSMAEFRGLDAARQNIVRAVDKATEGGSDG